MGTRSIQPQPSSASGFTPCIDTTLTTPNSNQASIPQLLEDAYKTLTGFKKSQCGQAYFATIFIARDAMNEHRTC